LLVGQNWRLMGEVSPVQRQFHRPAGETVEPSPFSQGAAIG
jgi:hypothetical protein